MTTSDTIKQTEQNIKTIREYLNNLEYNLESNATTIENGKNELLDDIDNAIEFIKDYNRLTKDLVKVLTDYYGK